MSDNQLAIAEPPQTIARADRPRGLKLESLDDYYRFADLAVASKLAPRGMEKVETIVVALIAGSELGFAPMQCLQNIGVINGKPAPYGDALPALVMDSGVCAEFDEWYEEEGERVEGAPATSKLADFPDSFTAVVSVRRKGRERARVQRFSVADAKRAQLWGKSGPWSQYPQRMLRFRALSFALRDEFPDVLRGFIAYEELRDFPQDDKRAPSRQATMSQGAPSPVANAPLASPEEIESYNAVAKKADEKGYRTGKGNAPRLFSLDEAVEASDLQKRKRALEAWLSANESQSDDEIIEEGEVVEETPPEPPKTLQSEVKRRRAEASAPADDLGPFAEEEEMPEEAPVEQPFERGATKNMKRFFAVAGKKKLDCSEAAREKRLVAVNAYREGVGLPPIASMNDYEDNLLVPLATEVEDGRVKW